MANERRLNLAGAPTGRELENPTSMNVQKPTARGPAVPPPSFSRVMLIMFWKNMTIRKRRKLEQLLMLFQIFIWFGWGAARFLMHSAPNFLPAIAPTQKYGNIQMYKPMSYPINHPIAVTVDSGQGWEPSHSRHLVKPNDIADYFKDHPTVDSDMLSDVLSMFRSLWERSIGVLPVQAFTTNKTLAEGMRDDNRIQWGLEVNNLRADDPRTVFTLTYWSDEIPLRGEAVAHTEACREMVPLLSRNIEFKELVHHSPRQCTAGKYLQSSYALAQSFLVTSIYRARLKRGATRDPEFITYPKFRTPLQQNLEFPGITLIAEDFPMHTTLYSDFPNLAQSTPLFVMFAFSRFLMTALQDMVAEKESKMKEVMKIFGLTTSQHWVSWLLTHMVMNLVYTGLTLVICRLCNMFGQSNYAVIGVMIYLYLLSLLTSGMMLSVFVQRQQTAMVIGMCVNLCLNALGWMLIQLQTQSQVIKGLCSLISTIAFSFALDESIRGLPMRRVTATNWFNFNEHHIGFYTIMLLVDAFGYFLIGLYLDHVIASSFGAAKKWYFPLTDGLKFLSRAFGIGSARYLDNKEPTFAVADDYAYSKRGFMEEVPGSLIEKGPAVQIRNLVKTFRVAGENKRAVDDLSLDIYRSEIFALLGHNGAGKTTTINILTGMLTADGGDAWVNGYNIKMNPREVQQSISVCPQHNIFMDELLCIEHLCFFAGLRGIDVQSPLLKLQNPENYGKELMGEWQREQQEKQMAAMRGLPEPSAKSVTTKTWSGVLKLIDRFGLTQKLFHHPRSLSGGQKRRLWLALAMVGEPHVVFLDEPTSGVDPMARQDIWKVIQDERKSGRCIIITTHHMEEADILADRKAVMAAGKLRCLGSSLFLKSKFGIGYYLEVQLARDASREDRLRYIKELSQRIKENIPAARRMIAGSDVGTLQAVGISSGIITYALPLTSVSTFGGLLKELQRDRRSLGIADFAMSMSTLEEVFFKLGQVETDEDLELLLGRTHAPSDARSSEEDSLEGAVEEDELEDGDEASHEPVQAGIHADGKRSSLALMQTQEDIGYEEPGESDELAADLTLERFPNIQKRPDFDASGWTRSQLGGIAYLRYAQVAHNKGHFIMDVILPTLFFILGLLFRRDGPGGIDTLFVQERAEHNLANYNTYLNDTIPYMIDSTLSDRGLKKVVRLIEKLPFRDLLMPVVDVMDWRRIRDEGYGIAKIRDDLKELIPVAARIASEMALDPQTSANFDLIHHEPRSTVDYLGRKTPHIPSFSYNRRDIPREGPPRVTTDLLPYVFAVGDDIRRTRTEGILLRNFLWSTTIHDMFGTWSNFYPAALSFEANSEPVTARATFRSDRKAPDEVLLRYMWNPYAVHSFPSFINGLGESILNNALKEDPLIPNRQPSLDLITATFPASQVDTNGGAFTGSPPLISEGKSDSYGPYRLEFRSHPVYREMPVFITSLTWALYTLLSLGSASLPLRFGSQIMYDKYMKCKHSLIVMGCSFKVYWIGTFLVNWVVMNFANTCVLAAICWFIPLFWKHSASLGAIQIGMLGYSGAMLVYAYFWTFIFQSSRSYNLFLNLSTVACAVGPAYLVALFHDAKYEIGFVSLRVLSHIIHRVLSFVLAPYCPIGMLMTCVMVMNQADSERRLARFEEFMSFENNVIWTILGSFFQTFVYGAIIIYMDSRAYTAKKPSRLSVGALRTWKEVRTMVRQQVMSRVGGAAGTPEFESMVPVQFQTMKDQDVEHEEKRVEDIMTVYNAQLSARMHGQSVVPRHFPRLQCSRPPKHLPPIVVHDLYHIYLPTSEASEPVVALKGLSLGVEAGEVMGLLGPNGAGKSTCINLLTCDSGLDAPSGGDGYLGGISVTRQPQEAFPYIGLVPQFDALWPDVTVRDNILTFARVKNMKAPFRERRIADLVNELGLNEHMHKRINELSGGNKRRTSVAVAFLGDPKVILMDEPSSGIDPAGRRKLLEIIQAKGKGKSIIITTHSMEEAESLCTKVGIVVNGEMQCLNTCLSIKNTYGSGIRLEIELKADWKQIGRLRVEERERALAFVRNEIHPRTELTEEVANRLFLNIPLTTADLGNIFDAMHKGADAAGIKEYGISQPTLDQVFIKFAKRQMGAQAPTGPEA